MNRKNFRKAPSAPIYTKFEGEAHAFLGLFFKKKFACGAEILAKTGTKQFLVWESSKNQFGRPKKKVDKHFENRPAPPPLENILVSLLFTSQKSD